jgi:hypothetical protein
MLRISRVFISAALGVGLMLLAFQSTGPIVAQDKAKEKPKAKPRIAINDPEKLKDDKDFAIQGEYEGNIVLNRGEVKIGVQVIAKGEGTFMVKQLMGGLPGAGWDGKTETNYTAKLNEDGTATIAGPNISGTIAAGKLTLKDGMKIDTSLSKVARTSPTIGAKPPQGAIVLFEKPGDEANWNGGKIIELSDGKFLNTGIKTKQPFGNFKAHVEFRLPWMPNSSGQGRGNSGFYMQDRYELQVLDSFGLKGENNECGGIYTLHKPSVNMCLPPMTWQTYDIDFTAATFDGDKKTAPAKVTVVHNGVKIHDGAELKGPTGGGQPESAKPGPIQLQNHGDPLVFRNIWVVEVK